MKSLSRVQLCDPMDCSLPGFSVHGIFQARVLEWVAISFSRTNTLSFIFLQSLYLLSPLQLITSLVAQMVKCLPTMQETRVQSLGQEDPLKKEMATHSSTLAWKIPWTEEPGSWSLWGCKESDTTYRLHSLSFFLIKKLEKECNNKTI